MIKVLHITAHLGGGIGRVLLNWISQANKTTGASHKISCLEDANPRAKEICCKEGILLNELLAGNKPLLIDEIKNSDVIIIHWWNHPQLYDFIVNASFPPCRIIFWAHVAGFEPPYVFSVKLLTFGDRFAVSMPYSLDTPAVRALKEREREQQIRVIFSSAGLETVLDVVPEPHQGFIVGYIGTVDYCKIHPDFIKMSSLADIPNVKFMVVGGDQHNEIQSQALQAGKADKFHFTGKVTDIRPYLSTFDVFGYPLRDNHYGTGEQVLIEAMAAGLPVVVLDHPCERHLVEHEISGLIARDKGDYISCLERLYRNPTLRKRIGDRAKEITHKRFSLESTTSAWHLLINEVNELPKTMRKWHNGNALAGAALMIEALGEAAGPFGVSYMEKSENLVIEAESVISKYEGPLASETRGSPFHYRKHFPDDPYLNLWCGLIETGQRKYECAVKSFEKAVLIGNRRIESYLSNVQRGISFF